MKGDIRASDCGYFDYIRDIKGQRCTLHPLHALPVHQIFSSSSSSYVYTYMNRKFDLYIHWHQQRHLAGSGFVTFTCDTGFPAVASSFISISLNAGYPISVSINIALAPQQLHLVWQWFRHFHVSEFVTFDGHVWLHSFNADSPAAAASSSSSCWQWFCHIYVSRGCLI